MTFPPAAVTVPRGSTGHAVLAGVVCGLVGFTSSFAVVLTGLQAVGASAEQAASGLLVLCVTMGLGCVLFSWRLRMPVTMAWSTPGAALLVTAAVPSGGFASAVGAFIVCGVLLALCGLIRPLERLVEGEADYVLYHSAAPWDHVPGALLLAEAGGVVGTPTGRPYLPRDIAPPGLVAAAGHTAYERVCRALASSNHLG